MAVLAQQQAQAALMFVNAQYLIPDLLVPFVITNNELFLLIFKINQS